MTFKSQADDTTQTARIKYDLLMAGVAYGKAIAGVAISAFPESFSDEVGEPITRITESALTSALDIYLKCGLDRSLRVEFENGFHVGLGNGFGEHTFILRAARALNNTGIKYNG
jgi:hypothetical protein